MGSPQNDILWGKFLASYLQSVQPQFLLDFGDLDFAVSFVSVQ